MHYFKGDFCVMTVLNIEKFPGAPPLAPARALPLLRLHPRLLPELLRQGSDIDKLLFFLLLESLSGALNHLYFSKFFRELRPIPHLHQGLCSWTLLRLHPRLLSELLRQWSDISKLLVFLLLESLSGALNHLYFSKISGGSAP